MKFLNTFLLTAFFLAVIITVPILTKLEPPSGFSVAENRALAEAPVLNAENILNGSYASGWESYLSDHVYRRSDWLTLYTKYKLAAGHNVVRDIVITDTALLPYVKFDEPNQYADAAATEMAERYRLLSDYTAALGGEFIYINVPEQCSMLSYLYPDGMYDGRLLIDSNNKSFKAAMTDRGIGYLDMRTVFETSGRAAEFYSQTDHHYNLHGAYLTYLSLCDMLPSLTAKTDVTFNELPNTFYGSRGRQIYNLTDFNDILTYITYDNPIGFTRYDNGAESSPFIYALPADENENVAYTLYMGGDIAETVIDTGRDGLPDVLIYGDSFTNALEAVLWTSCDRMASLDLRYYTGASLYDYIAAFEPDIVICLRDDTCTLSTDGNGAIPAPEK